MTSAQVVETSVTNNSSFRTILTRTITLYELLIFLGSNHLLKWTLLYSWRFSRYNAPIHWPVHGHMTSNNETVSRQTPWAGNIAKIMTSTGKQFTVTREMLTAVALFVFHRFDPFLLYNKSLNAWSLGEQWILFPSNLNVSLDFVSGNIEILGKQISLFPSGNEW